MNKENDKKSKYIEGIFNYCDRWCERCNFTSRCLSYDISKNEFGDTEKLDLTNKEFWDRLSKMFLTTLEMLKEEAEKMGIDLDSFESEEIKNDMIVKEESTKNNILVIKSKKYAEEVDKWFEESAYLFEQKGIELNQALELNLSNSNPYDNIYQLQDITEIVRWYQYQISAKLYRAVHGRMYDDDDLNEFPKDSDGSAKVALIGIDRSIMAWGKMLDHFPDEEDEILSVLIMLSRLKNYVEKEFPNARAFVRPGFDTIPK
ncbi:MAG: hypothetical protein PVH88_20760 [Ignavibacteria bacterium]|jgi:hypothetical protein